MIQFLDLNQLPPDVSRTEREYLTAITQENDDPSRQHSIIIRCWNEQAQTYQPARFFEPNEQQLATILSEISPFLAKLQANPACTCTEQHQQLNAAYQAINTATTGYQMTSTGYTALKDVLPKEIVKALKDLQGQVFYSPQDFSVAVLPLIAPYVKERDNLQTVGTQIMNAFQQVGVIEELRQQRRVELDDLLAVWHGVVPAKPMPPTSAPCPFCKLPYRYSFLEAFPYEQQTFSRITQILVGAPVLLRDIPRVLAALELWLFADDDAAFSKKNGLFTQTMTGQFMMKAKAWIHARRSQWMSLSDSPLSTAPTSPASVSSFSDVPPPPPPVPTPAVS